MAFDPVIIGDAILYLGDCRENQLGTNLHGFWPNPAGGVPMADLLKELTHYICWKVEDPSRLGATKLNKALWYSDTLAYRANGRAITNAAYVKRQFGPVPKRILFVLDELQAEGKIVVRERAAAYSVKELIAIEPPQPILFSEQERAIIDAVVGWICDEHTATSISELTHDSVWTAAIEGEEIPLYAVLGAAAGEVTDEDKEWANKIIASRHNPHAQAQRQGDLIRDVLPKPTQRALSLGGLS